jgi:aminoglycoside 2''-phosphotransferase
MSEAPWVSHRGWTLETVERQIAASFPALAGLEVRYLDEGWDFQVYVAGEWAFKFPKRDDYARALIAERALLDLLAPGCPIPVPQYELIAETEAGDVIAGYRLLPGVPGIEVEPGFTLPGGSAEPFAAFLNHVHGLDRDSAEVRGMAPERPEPTEEWFVDLRRYFDSVESHLPADLARGSRELLDSERITPFGCVCPKPFCHCDLAAEHILVRPATNRVAGVIDWSDSGPEDPAGDFAGIVAWQGRAFTEEVLSHYDRPCDEGLLRRAQAHGLNWIMCSLEYGLLDDRRHHWDVGCACLRRFLAEAD